AEHPREGQTPTPEGPPPEATDDQHDDTPEHGRHDAVRLALQSGGERLLRHGPDALAVDPRRRLVRLRAEVPLELRLHDDPVGGAFTPGIVGSVVTTGVSVRTAFSCSLNSFFRWFWARAVNTPVPHSS